MRILVTGGAGFIGSHLSERLASSGHQVIILDNLENGTLNNIRHIKNNLRVIRGDILNYSIVQSIVKDIDVIYHLAARVTVRDSFSGRSEYEKVNIQGTKTILDAARRQGVKKFFFASSAAVYGNTANIPICETAIPAPLSPLGKTKLQAEKLCLQAKSKGLPVTIFRFFNAYGPRQNEKYENVITRFTQDFLSNSPTIIYGDGKQTRDFIFIQDLIDIYLKILVLPASNINTFNVGRGKEISILKLYRSIQKLFTNKNKIIRYVIKQPGDINRSCACICQAEKYLGFSPTTTLMNGLKKTIS